MSITKNAKLETRYRRQLGFTLIEMMVVITIISIVALIVVPRLPSSDAADLQHSARSLAAAIRYLGDTSITAKTVHKLHINLTEGTVRITRYNAAGEETASDDSFFVRRFIAEGIAIQDVQVPRLGKVSEGEVSIPFGAAGLEEFMLIHLLGSRGSYFTIAAFPHTGKVKIYEGYREDEL